MVVRKSTLVALVISIDALAGDTPKVYPSLVSTNLIVEREFKVAEKLDPVIVRLEFYDERWLDSIEIFQRHAYQKRYHRLLFADGFYENAQNISFSTVSKEKDPMHGFTFADVNNDGFIDIEMVGVSGSGASLTYRWIYEPVSNTYLRAEEIQKSWGN